MILLVVGCFCELQTRNFSDAIYYKQVSPFVKFSRLIFP